MQCRQDNKSARNQAHAPTVAREHGFMPAELQYPAIPNALPVYNFSK